MTPIMRDATHKLSKRDGDAYFEDYLQKGYLKEAIVNYVALLGWNPGDEREFFTLDELVEAFSIRGMSKSPAIFDVNKLTWMNAEYIRRLTPEAFTAHALPYYEQAGVAGMDAGILCRILQPRTAVFSEIPGMVDFLAALPAYGHGAVYEQEIQDRPGRGEGRAVARAAGARRAAGVDGGGAARHAARPGRAAGAEERHAALAGAHCAGRPAGHAGGAIEIAALLGREESLRRLEAGLARL